MKTFVQVIGPYDSTVVGPFATAELALAFKATVPDRFDGHVMTQAELDANFAEFGKSEIEPPERYSFGDDHLFNK